jgi:hypothetical protein
MASGASLQRARRLQCCIFQPRHGTDADQVEACGGWGLHVPPD